MIKHNLKLNDFDFDEIVNIEEFEELPTIDIEVEDTHMFYVEDDIYTHNSGLNAEVITMESISEAFNKCFIADFIFSLSRTIDDKNTNTGRIFIAKNRAGPDGFVFPIFMDPGRVKIDVLKSESAKVVNEDPFKSVEDKLKEKYRKHVKKNGNQKGKNGNI